MQNDISDQRAQAHAKLFSTDHGQVVAYLNRDENDALTVLLQLWVATTDEPLRALIRADNDALTQAIFEALDDEGVPQVLEELGIVDLLAALEAEHG